MLVRAIALSLALLIGVGVIIPFATDDAQAKPHRKHRKQRHYKKYSKAWWRQYHRRQRRLQAIRARKRAMRLQQLRLAREHEAEKNGTQASSKPAATVKTAKGSPTALPSGETAPSGWRASQASPAELQFRIDNSSGAQVGSASISVVGPAMQNAASGNKTVGGVSTSSLRRDVIDRMIRENGWVVNDYQKDVDGQPVYVVVAQSQAKNGNVQSRMFYFTEVDGRIYSVATNSPMQEAERLADESEKVINSLKTRIRPGVRASN